MKLRPLVRALGRIGNRDSVPYLKDILESKSLLNRARLDELKLEVFRSLKGYPPAAVEPLLKLGVWSDQPEIKAISAEIMTALYSEEKGKKNDKKNALLCCGRHHSEFPCRFQGGR